MKRYKFAIEEWSSFLNSYKEQPVKTVRKNNIKAKNDFEEKLRKEFDNTEKSSWNKNIFRLKDTVAPGKSMMHWLGEYYVQEESAALPVEVLSPEKGDKILDMCAAPGGKSTQIASKIENKGTVIANDDDASRLKSLHANVYRTGSACISVTNYDGRNFPGRNRFDKILVDAPCSGEPDRARRAAENADFHDEDVEEAILNSGAGEDEIEGLSELQKQLIERAAELLKDGGTLVYSTCTFAPEENEEVVKHAIEETELEIIEIETEIPQEKGLTEFKEEKYSDKMLKTVRVYPYHLNSGGIFVAKFRK